MSREVHLKLGADTQHYDSQSLGFSMVAQDEKRSPPAKAQSSVKDPVGPEDGSRAETSDEEREFEHASLNPAAIRMPQFTTVSVKSVSEYLNETAVPQRAFGDGRHPSGFAEPDANLITDDFSDSIDSYFEDRRPFPEMAINNGTAFLHGVPPAGFTNLTNVSPSQVATFRATSPSRQSGPREGIDLDQMSNSDLANYLDDHGAGAETLELIVRERWSGHEWASTFCPEISHSPIHET